MELIGTGQDVLRATRCRGAVVDAADLGHPFAVTFSPRDRRVASFGVLRAAAWEPSQVRTRLGDQIPLNGELPRHSLMLVFRRSKRCPIVGRVSAMGLAVAVVLLAGDVPFRTAPGCGGNNSGCPGCGAALCSLAHNRRVENLRLMVRR